MRTFHRSAIVLNAVIVMGILPGGASAGDGNYIINQNQTGINLPGVVSPNGFDEVRAADGTTCRSSMSGSGAYIDSGVVGGGLGGEASNSVSAYGRLVVPLGEKPKRLNCDRLYQLELQRLQLEVQMLKRGLDPRMSNATSNDAGWANDSGWTNGSRK